MGKYLMTWEVDNSRIPIDPKERGAMWGAMQDMIRQDMEKGLMKDWGIFVGELSGYGVVEGTELEVATMTQQYVPFVTFKTYQISSLDLAAEIVKALTG